MISFSNLLSDAIRTSQLAHLPYRNQACQTYTEKHCTICPAIQFSYSDELKIKEQVFREFWKKNNLSGQIEPLVASPMGRRYRTNSKRRVFNKKLKEPVILGFTEIMEFGIRPFSVIDCPIEPEEHSRIYNYIQDFVNNREGFTLGNALNHVIIKGNYEEYTVIFSTQFFSTKINSLVNRLSKLLTHTFPKITGIFIVADVPGKFYLSSKAEQRSLKKIFGNKEVFEEVGDKKFLYSPVAFSQTNSSMIVLMVEKVKNFLKLNKGVTVLDLYCGYGLFGLSLAGLVQSVIGMEISKEAIVSAKDNARRQNATGTRFFCAPITPSSLQKIHFNPAETAAILDPPRSGTDEGVIEWLADSGIRQALHVFCEIDLIPLELSRWTKKGYQVARVVPLDMFPATQHIETIVLLERK